MKNSTIREVEKLEAAMAVKPPVIEWRLDPVRRVQIAVVVEDPYADDGVRWGERRTHCRRRHAFTEENTIVRPGDGARECRTCKRERNRKRSVAA